MSIYFVWQIHCREKNVLIKKKYMKICLEQVVRTSEEEEKEEFIWIVLLVLLWGAVWLHQQNKDSSLNPASETLPESKHQSAMPPFPGEELLFSNSTFGKKVQ